MCLRLAFNNAGTWDWKTKTGGMTGAIAIPEYDNMTIIFFYN